MFEIHISTSGNDFTGLGTFASPYSSMQRAFAAAREKLFALSPDDVTISINTAGTYQAFIVDFMSFIPNDKSLTIRSSIGRNVVFDGTCVLQGKNISITGPKFISALGDALQLWSANGINLQDCDFSAAAGSGLHLIGNGHDIRVKGSRMNGSLIGLHVDSDASYPIADITDNLIFDNGIGAKLGIADNINFSLNTVAFNDKGVLIGEANQNVPKGTLSSNIITFNTMGLVIGDGYPALVELVISNNDIYGNSLADYHGIDSMEETDGNFSADPMFTNGSARDFTLLQNSPCFNRAGVNVDSYRDFLNSGRHDKPTNDVGALKQTAAFNFIALDRGFSTVRQLNGAPGHIESKLSIGNPGSFELGPHGDLISKPRSIAMIGGSIYVADTGGKRIVRLNPEFRIDATVRDRSSMDNSQTNIIENSISGVYPNPVPFGDPVAIASSGTKIYALCNVNANNFVWNPLDKTQFLSGTQKSLMYREIDENLNVQTFFSLIDGFYKNPESMMLDTVTYPGQLLTTIVGMNPGIDGFKDDLVRPTGTLIKLTTSVVGEASTVFNSHTFVGGSYFACDGDRLIKMSLTSTAASLTFTPSVYNSDFIGMSIRIVGLTGSGNIIVFNGKESSILEFDQNLSFIKEMMSSNADIPGGSCRGITHMIELPSSGDPVTPYDADRFSSTRSMMHWITVPDMTLDRATGKRLVIENATAHHGMGPDMQMGALTLIPSTEGPSSPDTCLLGSNFHVEDFASQNNTLFDYTAFASVVGSKLRLEHDVDSAPTYTPSSMSLKPSLAFTGDFNLQLDVHKYIRSINAFGGSDIGYLRLQETGNLFSIELYCDDPNIYGYGCSRYFWRIKKGSDVLRTIYLASQSHDAGLAGRIGIRRIDSYIHFYVDGVIVHSADYSGDPNILFNITSDGQHAAEADNLYISIASSVLPINQCSGSSHKARVISDDLYNESFSISFWLRNKNLNGNAQNIMSISAAGTGSQFLIRMLDNTTIEISGLGFVNIDDITLGGTDFWHQFTITRKQGVLSLYQNKSRKSFIEDDTVWGGGDIIICEGSSNSIYDIRIQNASREERSIQFYHNDIVDNLGALVLPMTR